MRACQLVTRTFCNGDRLYYLQGDCAQTQSFARKKNAMLFAKRLKLAVTGEVSVGPKRNPNAMEATQ